MGLRRRAPTDDVHAIIAIIELVCNGVLMTTIRMHADLMVSSMRSVVIPPQGDAQRIRKPKVFFSAHNLLCDLDPRRNGFLFFLHSGIHAFLQTFEHTQMQTKMSVHVLRTTLWLRYKCMLTIPHRPPPAPQPQMQPRCTVEIHPDFGAPTP